MSPSTGAGYRPRQISLHQGRTLRLLDLPPKTVFSIRHNRIGSKLNSLCQDNKNSLLARHSVLRRATKCRGKGPETTSSSENVRTLAKHLITAVKSQHVDLCGGT